MVRLKAPGDDITTEVIGQVCQRSLNSTRDIVVGNIPKTHCPVRVLVPVRRLNIPASNPTRVRALARSRFGLEKERS
jgi:hypothetical protein